MRDNPDGRALLKRIYESAAYGGIEPLSVIARDYEGKGPGKFAYLSLWKHSHTHQGIDADTLAESRIHRLSKDMENTKIRELVSHTDIRQSILDAAKKLMEDPEWVAKIKPSDALKAAKDTSDIEEKHLDRQVEVLKMVNAFASGEIVREPEGVPNGIATQPPAGYIEGV